MALLAMDSHQLVAVSILAVSFIVLGVLWLRTSTAVRNAHYLRRVDLRSDSHQSSLHFTSTVRIGFLLSPLTAVHYSRDSFRFVVEVPGRRGGYQLSRASLDGLVVKSAVFGSRLVPLVDGRIDYAVSFGVAGSRSEWEETLFALGWLAICRP